MPPVGNQPPVGWEPPPAVYQQYAVGPPPGSAGAPEGLKILTIIISVLKAIPLGLSLILLLFLGAVADGIDDVDGLDAFDAAFTAVLVIFLLFIGFGALLLFFQLRSVLKSQMTALAVLAGVMAAIDLLALLGSFTGSDSSAGGGLLMLAVFAGQATIFGWALKARNANPF